MKIAALKAKGATCKTCSKFQLNMFGIKVCFRDQFEPIAVNENYICSRWSNGVV
jgi:hypothetical protein